MSNYGDIFATVNQQIEEDQKLLNEGERTKKRKKRKTKDDPFAGVTSSDEFYRKSLAGLSRSQIGMMHHQEMAPRFSNEQSFAVDRHANFAREAADNSDETGRFLDSENKAKDILGSGYDTFEGWLMGYNNQVFAKPMPYEKQEFKPDTSKDAISQSIEKMGHELGEAWKKQLATGAGDAINKFVNEDQKYSFLYPARDPETGKPILKEFIGTKKQFRETGMDAYQTFGLQAQNDEFYGFGDLLKSGANMLLQTDDLLLGVTKGGRDLFSMGTPFHAMNMLTEDGLDRAHRIALDDTAENSYLNSAASQEMGTLEWFGSGIGSIAGSYAQFGGAGALVGGSLRAAGGILARTAGKELLKQEAIATASRYGASALVGFGSAYNDAKTNGLSDQEALAFGLTVGGISAAIESSGLLGKTDIVDKMLLGGGQKAISQALLADIKGEVTQEALEASTRKLLPRLLQSVQKVPGTGYLRPMLEEGGEEGAQTISDLMGKVVFDGIKGLYNDDAEKGKGKFGQELGLDQVKEVISASLIGALGGGGMTVLTGPQKDTISRYIQEGRADHLKAGLDNLLAGDEITTLQHKNYSDYIDGLNKVYGEHKGAFAHIEDKAIKDELWSHLHLARQLQIQSEADSEKARQKEKEIGSENHAAMAPATDAQKKEILDLKEASGKKQKQAQEALLALDKYADPEYVKTRKDFLDKAKEEYRRIQNNAFEQYVKPAEAPEVNPEKLVKRAQSQQQVAYRHAEEVNAVLGMIAGKTMKPEEEGDVIIALQKSLTTTGNELLLSPLVNTLQNRPILESLGIDASMLPLTPEEQQAYDVSVAAGAVDADLAARTYSTGEMLALQQAAADDLNKDQTDPDMLFAPGEAAVYQYLLQQGDKFGVDKKRLASRGNRHREQLEELFGKDSDEMNVLRSMEKASGKTLIPIIEHVEGLSQPDGMYHVGSGALVMRFDTVKAAKNKKYRQKVFALATHENTHGLFDQALIKGHGDFVKWLNGGKATPEALQFQRLLKLAELAFHGLSDKNGKAASYFLRDIGPDNIKNIYSKTANSSLTLVKEFFAEALSSEVFQQQLGAFDMNSKKNAAIVQDKYGYSRMTGKPHTLLQEVFNALRSVFGSLRKALTAKQRTLMSEAYDMASTINMSYFHVQEVEVDVENQLAFQSFSMYAPELIADGLQQDVTELSELILKRYATLADGPAKRVFTNPDTRAEFHKNFNKFIEDNLLDSAEPGTDKVVFFPNTNDLLLVWEDQDGTPHRQFFNVYGQPKLINSNVFNREAGNTLAKPDYLQTFNGSYNDPTNKLNREVLNNLDEAQQENFEGKLELLLTDRAWHFNGEQIQGQVEVIYTNKAGHRKQIGWMPDLTKIRLAGILSKGARVELRVMETGDGSRAFVQRDDQGRIQHVKKWSKGAQAPAGYTEERIMPNISLAYGRVEGMKSTDAMPQDGDHFTFDDGTEVNTAPEAFQSWRDLIVANAVDEEAELEAAEILNGLSFYNPDTIQNPELRDLMTFFDKVIKRRIRRNLAFSPVQEESRASAVKLMNQMYLSINGILDSKFPGDPQAENFGMTPEELAKYKESVLTENAKLVNNYKSRQGEADWDGHGQNPSNAVSAKIKYDLETVSYTYRDKHYLLDYSEASEVLYEAARGTENFDELLESLLAYSDNDLKSEYHRTVAAALYNHLSKPLSREKELLEAARNTYWSQFGSYARRDAVVFKPADQGVKKFYASQSQQLDDLMQQDAKAVRARAEDIRRAWEESDKALSLEEFYAVQTGTEVRGNAKGYVTNIGIIGTFKEGITSKQLGTDGVNGSTLTDADYEKKSQQLIDYLGFMGIEVSADLLKRKQVDSDSHELIVEHELAEYERDLGILFKERLQQKKKSGVPQEEYDAYRAELVDKYHQLMAEKKAKLSALPANRHAYHMATFVRREKKWDDNDKTKRPSQYTYFELYAQIADRIHMDMLLALQGKPTTTQTMGDLKVLRQKQLEISGNYKSPAFYLDTNLNKRWAMKIKSYSDHLLERLKLNKGGLMTRFKASRMYANNIIVKQLANDPGAVEWVSVAGIVSEEGFRNNTDYTGASKIDFAYMHLAAFVAGGASQYFHIEDVPSDKPQLGALQLAKIGPDEFGWHLANIIGMEQQRELIAQENFDEAFEELPDGTYVVMNDEAFNKLVPGVHYQEVKGKDKVYQKGHIFDKRNYFFDGADVATIIAELNKEVDEHFAHYQKRGLRIPVSPDFLKTNEKLKNENPEQYAEKLQAEQYRVFRDYTYNYTINRYHLTQLQMGDSIFFKQRNPKTDKSDEFADLNKRHAGPAAPFQRGVWSRKQATMAILKDEEIKGHRMPQVVANEDGTFSVKPGEGASISSNRGDAQSYMTEEFLEEVKAAYGAFAEYDSPFKPVLFGVNEEFLDEARPMYLKLSMTVVPNPALEKNQAFYDEQPEFRAFAEKFYSEGVDTAIFESGVKVGAPARTARIGSEWNVQQFDLNLFGLQNNPAHHADSESTISAGVQMEKQLGDNGNFDAMVRYHAIVTNILQSKANQLFEGRLANATSVYEFLREQLASQAHTEEIARSLDQNLRLDNPIVATLFENLTNSLINKVVSSPRKDGEKLVNTSDLGFNRPLTQEDKDNLLAGMDADQVKVAQALRWKGPRTMADLTPHQLKIVEARMESEPLENIFEGGDSTKFIIGTDGELQIFPADILVPAGRGYEIGQPLISNRVPGSAKNSVIAGEVVGFLPESMGNIIVTPKEGPGILGFDFDIDGLFTWRKDKSSAEVQEMFDVAWNVLLAPRNYTEITTPVSTDEMQRLAGIFGERRAKREPKTSRFTPFRQFNLKNQNTVGKDMIGITAKAYGIWSVMSQVGAHLVASEMPMVGFTFNDRAYNLEKVRTQHFPQYDTQGRPVFDSFQQTLNAATDNVKEMALGRIGLNQLTAPVYMDMLSHGFPLEYVGYFLNQDIIQEFVDEKERQGSATFTGDRDSAYDLMVARWEAKAREIDPNYEYNPMQNGVSVREDIIYAYKERPEFMTQFGLVEAEVMMSKVDRRSISLTQLHELYEYSDKAEDKREKDRKELRFIDQQLAILEKFKYYTELAGVTSKGGALVSLASSYPKTYLEVWNAYRKVNTVLGEWDGEKWAGQKLNIVGLTQDRNLNDTKYHPYFAFQYKMLRRTLNFYSQHRLYADTPFMEMHEEVAGDKSIDMQETVMKDFYTYLLTSQPLFNTESFNGNRLPAEDFVHAAANTVRWMKDNGFGDHEFLRHISVKDGKFDNLEGAKIPDTLKFQQLYDMDSEELDRVYRAWDELPGDLDEVDLSNPEYQAGLLEMDGERIDVKRLLLGYLAHTSGFNAGGFTFARLLPPSVKKQLDKGISDFQTQYYSAQYDLKNPNQWIREAIGEETYYRLFLATVTRPDEEMGEYTMRGLELLYNTQDSDVQQALEDAGVPREVYEYIAQRIEQLNETVNLSDFRRQVYLNNPELITSLPELKVKQLLNEGYATAKVNGEIVLRNDVMHGVAKAIFEQVQRAGMVVKMRMGEGAQRGEVIYEATATGPDELVLVPSTFEKVKGVQQYYRGSKALEPLPITPAFTPLAQEYRVDIGGGLMTARENPLTAAGILPSDMNGNAAKDIAMAEVASQFIGEKAGNAATSSTEKYKEAWGTKANTGTYTSQDVVMVSGSGPWRGVTEADIKEKLTTFYKPLLSKAIDAGAQFVVGRAAGADKLIGKYLLAHGYEVLPEGGFDRYTKTVSEHDEWANLDHMPDVQQSEEITPEMLQQLYGSTSYFQPEKVAPVWQQEFAALRFPMSVQEFITVKKRQHECN